MRCSAGVDQHPVVWIEGEVSSLCVISSFGRPLVYEESLSVLTCTYIEKLDISGGSHC